MDIKKLEKVHDEKSVKLFKQLHDAPQRGVYNSMLGRKTEGGFEIKRKIGDCIKVMRELRTVYAGDELDGDSELDLG